MLKIFSNKVNEHMLADQLHQKALRCCYIHFQPNLLRAKTDMCKSSAICKRMQISTEQVPTYASPVQDLVLRSHNR